MFHSCCDAACSSACRVVGDRLRLDQVEVEARRQPREARGGRGGAVLWLEQAAVARSDGAGDLEPAAQLPRAGPAGGHEWIAVRRCAAVERLAQRRQRIDDRVRVHDRTVVVSQPVGRDDEMHRILELSAERRGQLARRQQRPHHGREIAVRAREDLRHRIHQRAWRLVAHEVDRQLARDEAGACGLAGDDVDRGFDLREPAAGDALPEQHLVAGIVTGGVELEAVMPHQQRLQRRFQRSAAWPSWSMPAPVKMRASSCTSPWVYPPSTPSVCSSSSSRA